MDLIIVQSTDALLQSQKTLIDFSTFDPVVVIQLVPKVKRLLLQDTAGIEKELKKANHNQSNHVLQLLYENNIIL